MRNRIVVNIGGKDYTMVAAEDEGYVRRCAELVNRQLSEVSAGGRLSQADGAVLAAMNIADQYFKEQQTAEALRQQIKDSLDEIARLKDELSQTKRELFKAQNRKN